MLENEEAMDEMRIIINNKATRHILSSILSKAINDKIALGLDLDVDSLIVNTTPDGNLEFRLAVKGTADKSAIFDLLRQKGGSK